MSEEKIDPIKSSFGLVRTFKLGMDCTKTEFKKTFEANVAERSFFTSFKKLDQKYHGIIERDGESFELKERRGIFGGKKLVPNISGTIRETNFTTVLDVKVSFDVWTYAPLLIVVCGFFSMISVQRGSMPGLFWVILPIVFVINFFQMRHYANRTAKMIQADLQLWVLN